MHIRQVWSPVWYDCEKLCRNKIKFPINKYNHTVDFHGAEGRKTVNDKGRLRAITEAAVSSVKYHNKLFCNNEKTQVIANVTGAKQRSQGEVIMEWAGRQGKFNFWQKYCAAGPTHTYLDGVIVQTFLFGLPSLV